jgi:hypothetical protein
MVLGEVKWLWHPIFKLCIIHWDLSFQRLSCKLSIVVSLIYLVAITVKHWKSGSPEISNFLGTLWHVACRECHIQSFEMSGCVVKYEYMFFMKVIFH